MDPVRDTTLIENPDRLSRFCLTRLWAGVQMGMDATSKWPGETQREWGRLIVMDEKVKQRVDEIWQQLGL